MPTILAAGVASVLAPPLVARVWGVPFGFVSVSVVLRTAILTGVLTATLALVAGTVLRVAGVVPSELADPAGAGLGLVLGLLGIAARSAHDRGPKAILALAVNLRDPDVRGEAIGLIEARLSRERTRSGDGPGERFARMTLVASAPMMALDRADVAADHLAAVDPTRLSRLTLGRWARALAGLRLQQGDAGGADAVVRRVPRPAIDPSVERWLATIDALLAAIRGEADAALTALGELDDGAANRSTETMALRALRLSASAHAHAAKGDEASAIRDLQAMREITPAALDFVRQPEGPASHLADRV